MMDALNFAVTTLDNETLRHRRHLPRFDRHLYMTSV
jgi:hypothetical protein